MQESLLREIADEFLVPFFSGARLKRRPAKSSAREKPVAFLDPLSIAFKVEEEDPYRLILTRSQPFEKAKGTVVPEIQVVQAFVDVVRPMAEALSTDLRHDLLSTFQRRVVAKAISSKEERESVLLAGIDQLETWSERRYEGSPISATIGFRHSPQRGSVPNLAEVGKQEVSAVMSNGHDTLLEFDFAGRLISHRSLASDEPPTQYSPLRQAPVAQWTSEDERRRRVAMCLNRLGEILVFRDARLLFAYRSGRWRFLTHDPVIKQMGTPNAPAIRKAVYETCLDASFARTGACIGVVGSSHRAEWSDVVGEDDDLPRSASAKARLIERMVRRQPFHRLDRRLRQELTGIDGATVLSHKGEVLAVGAILKIPGGSAGGGRLAAAKALGKLGLGIKVSQDGGITGFRAGRSEPAFLVM